MCFQKYVYCTFPDVCNDIDYLKSYGKGGGGGGVPVHVSSAENSTVSYSNFYA